MAHFKPTENPTVSTTYRAARNTARRQRIKERDRRMRSGEELSSDDDGHVKGLGLVLLEYMKKDTHEGELIKAFESALAAPAPTLELESGVYVPPAYGSTQVSWPPVEQEYENERARFGAREREMKRDRRSAVLKKLKSAGVNEARLEHLGLDDEGATAVCEDLRSCSSLTSISLALNDIGPGGVAVLSEVLQEMPMLTSLSLSHNRIQTEGARVLALALAESTSLMQLQLSSNNIGPDLPDEFLELTSLKMLSLRGNALVRIPVAITTMLEALDLNANSSDLSTFLSEEMYVQQGLANTRHLHRQGLLDMDQAWAHWRELNIKAARVCFERASKALQSAGVMHVLTEPMAELEEAILLREKALGPNFVHKKEDPTQLMVGESIERGLTAISNRATQLSFYSQRIADYGVTSIARQLKATSSNILWLDLSGCDIGPEGAKELSLLVLSSNHTLKTLWLDHNRIGDHGATHLAEGLITNTTIAKLDLTHNNIKGEGMKRLAHSLKANPSFRALLASFNWVGDTGGKEVASALKSLCNLQEVDLSGGGIGVEGSRALSDAFKTHNGILFGKLWR